MKRRIGDFSPLFRMIRKHIQFEGRSATIHRYNETADPTQFREASGEITARRVPMRSFGLAEVAAAFDIAAQQFAKQHSEMMIETMNEVTAKTGNVVDTGGKPLDKGTLLEIFEKMQFSFSAEGNWLPPTVLGGAAAFSAHSAIMADPAFQHEFAKLLSRKLDEHRYREAGRNLVG